VPDSAVAPNAEALLKRLEWTVLRRLDGILQGDFRTLLRGTGIDLADLRPYQPHDDVRHIDWNVTARLAEPHVRVFTEDREMAAWFLVDVSASVDFGSGAHTKRALAQGFAGVLARLLTRHGNRVGALVYDGVDPRGWRTLLPARSGRMQVLQLLRALATPAPQASHATELGALLRAAGGIVRRRSTFFVMSDFASAPGWEKPLAALAARHDVVAVRLVDPLELELPDLGLLPIRDAETGETLVVDTHDRGFRRRFARIAAQREAELRAAFGAAGTDVLELSTDADLVDAVVRFVDLRRRRVRSRAAHAKVA
jgi:uncharacterized protein (DUF58 family)